MLSVKFTVWCDTFPQLVDGSISWIMHATDPKIRSPQETESLATCEARAVNPKSEYFESIKHKTRE